jgi:hypothetical protein
MKYTTDTAWKVLFVVTLIKAGCKEAGFFYMGEKKFSGGQPLSGSKKTVVCRKNGICSKN